MAEVLRSHFAGLVSIPAGYSRAKSWLICPSSSPQKLSCSSISRPPRRSASKCQRHCSPAPMMSSNDGIFVAWHESCPWHCAALRRGPVHAESWRSGGYLKYCQTSVLENQICCRAVSEDAVILVAQVAFGEADTAAARNDPPLSFHQTRLRDYQSNEGNFEFKSCLRKALVEHGQDREPHTGVEQGCSKPAVNGPEWVAVLFVSFGRDNDMALAHLNDIVAEGLG